MRTLVTATFLLAAIAVPVQAAASRGDSSGAQTPPPSAPAPASPATDGASALRSVPASVPVRESVPAPLLAPAPSAPAPAAGGAPVPAPEPPSSQPLPDAQSSPTPIIEGLESPRKPEPERVPEKITLEDVPALVPQGHLAGATAAAALPSGDEPQLVQIARVRDKQKDGGGDVQVPLDGDRPARPGPSAPARPAQLPRTGLDVVPLAAMGLAMLIAGLAVLRVSRLGRAAARQPTG